MNQLHQHFLENLVDRLREDADPQGCAFCAEFDDGTRCHSCADNLATVDAIESVTTEVADLTNERDQALQANRHYRISEQLWDKERDQLTAEVKSAFHAGFVYAVADVKRGHRTWNDVDKKFHEWKASDLTDTPSGSPASPGAEEGGEDVFGLPEKCVKHSCRDGGELIATCIDCGCSYGPVADDSSQEMAMCTGHSHWAGEPCPICDEKGPTS